MVRSASAPGGAQLGVECGAESALCAGDRNHSTFAKFVRQVEALGVNEIDIWREGDDILHWSSLRGFLQRVRWADMTPPPGTTASIPEWLLSELAGFLKRGEETNAEPFGEDRDRRLSALHPGSLLL